MSTFLAAIITLDVTIEGVSFQIGHGQQAVFDQPINRYNQPDVNQKQKTLIVPPRDGKDC